jgi:hypothetical protein
VRPSSSTHRPAPLDRTLDAGDLRILQGHRGRERRYDSGLANLDDEPIPGWVAKRLDDALAEEAANSIEDPMPSAHLGKSPSRVRGRGLSAADDTGAPTALHITPAHLPHDVTEILLVAQLPASHTRPPVLDALDLDTGRPIGRLQLPTPGPTGLLQLAALHRTDHGCELQPQPARLEYDLAGLATAAGVDVG